MNFKSILFILLFAVTGQAFAQSISGTVSDASGPLPGASVIIKGTSTGVVTDFDGNYTLNNVSLNDVLSFSYVGFKTQEITFTGQERIDVLLVEDLVALDEVVIVNYGTQKNIASSIIKGDELSEFPNTDLGQALQGRAAGVNITNGGSPGSQTLIQIRGINTFGDGRPLIVVDGVFTDNVNSIDLASIEKVDILKDAASTAVYGSRGTNGVVLITTKKGKIGKATFSLNISSGIQEFNRRYDLLNTGQYIQFLREVNATININTDANVNNWLDIGQTLAISYTETTQPERDGGRDPLQNIIGQAPYIPVRQADGNFGGVGSEDLNDSRNQIRIQSTQDNLDRNTNIFGSLFANIKLAEGLTFRTQFGLNANLFLQDTQRRAFTEGEGRFANPINFVGKIRQVSTQTIFTNTLAFDRVFDDKHAINASAVLEQTRIRLETAAISDLNQVSSSIPEAFSPNARASSFSVPDNINSVLFLAGYEYDDRYSISGSARRDASSRFPLDNGNAFQWFFSGSLGWNVTEESWFDVEAINNLKLRASYGETGNNRVGNGPLSVNQFNPLLGVNLPASIGNETVTGISPVTAGNPDLRWETQIKQNYGLDIAFLYDQIQFGADYFSNRSRDLLIPVDLPASAGVPGNNNRGSSVTRNVGDVKVDGFEFSLGYNDYKGKFKWNLSANLTTSRSIVQDLGPSDEPIERARLDPPFDSALNRLAVGEAPFHFFGLVSDGVFSTQEEVDAALPNNSAAAVPVQPGDVRFRDINGDGLISLEDRTVIGNPNPDFTYALNFKAEYNGWDFDVLLNGVQGVDILNSNIFYLEGLDNGFNFGTQILRRWQNPGDITDIPRFRFGSNINNEISTRYIEEGSYLRLRNVTVGYTFPDKLINKSGKGILKKLRVYVQGQNLLTLTNYTGFDPETAPFYNAAGLVDGLGIDRSAQPRPITVLSGIQLEF